MNGPSIMDPVIPTLSHLTFLNKKYIEVYRMHFNAISCKSAIVSSAF